MSNLTKKWKQFKKSVEILKKKIQWIKWKNAIEGIKIKIDKGEETKQSVN